MANGGRDAAYRTRRCLAGETDVARFLRVVPNRTLCGSPNPASSVVPVAKRRQPADIEVTFPLSGTQPPISVTLSVRQFPLHARFGRTGFRGDPACAVPFLGRPASEESEPFPSPAAGRPAACGVYADPADRDLHGGRDPVLLSAPVHAPRCRRTGPGRPWDEG